MRRFTEGEKMKIGERVTVKQLDSIVKPLHGKSGTIERIKEFRDHNGVQTQIYIALDSPVQVGGGIVLEELNLPKECVTYEVR
jgi:hypothetical protein